MTARPSPRPHLAGFPFFARLSIAAQRELGALAPIRAAAGAPLLRPGDPAGGAYLVVDGALRVFYTTADGHEATLYRVEPGQTCVLALSATVHDQPYPAWVESGASGAGFVRVPVAAFHRLVDGEPAFRGFVLAAMTGRIFELMCALEEAGSTQVEVRVARYLARRAAAERRIEVIATQAAIASELGTAREVVFRALRGLAGRGLVVTGRGRIRILDAAGLARVGAGPRAA